MWNSFFSRRFGVTGLRFYPLYKIPVSWSLNTERNAKIKALLDIVEPLFQGFLMLMPQSNI